MSSVFINLPVASSGGGTSDFSGTPGAANPAFAAFVAGTDGTLLRPLLTDAGGVLQVAITGSSGALATAAKQDDQTALLTTINSALAGTLTVTGPLTDTQLRASAVPVSMASAPLPTGAATEATLAAMNAKVPALGQALAAASVPVVLTAAQLSTLTPLSTVAATQSGTWNITNISGTVSLPTGAATETTLAAVNTKLPAGLTVTSTRLLVDASGTTQPVSGTVAATQSGTWNIATVTTLTGITNALPAGTNILGKVGIDQTTPGTTNAMSLAQLGANAVSTGNGTAGTGVLRVAIASDNTAFTVNTQAIPVSSNTNALSSAASTALANSLVIKAGSGRLYQLTGMNTSASTQYIQIHNTTSAPANASVPIYSMIVPPGQNFSIDWNELGRYFSTGVTVTNSSTAATLTIGSADCWFNAEYL